MNSLIENKEISEMACGPNFSYILNDNASFLSTDYKVLQSQTNSCFVKCMKMLYNGKVQIYYMTKDLRPFASMIPSLDADSFLTIVSNLFSGIIDVKNNGFLSCQNIDISLEKIYVDASTYKVSLVYIPLSKRIFDAYSSFESAIRTELVKLISCVSTISSDNVRQLSADLSNGTLTLEEVFSRIKGAKKTGTGQGAVHGAGLLRMVALDAPSKVEIAVTKDSFVIGKKPELCDGVVQFNKMISRSHCRVNKTGTQYTITDLQSANGTYVNKKRLQPNQPYPIKNGDIVRLANSDFQVSVE